jgi:hypothetical protein
LSLLIPLLSGLRRQLALLLTLCLSPDTDQPTGATTHALQALPRNFGALPPHRPGPTTSSDHTTLVGDQCLMYPLVPL